MSNNKRSRNTIQLKTIAVNIFGWAIADPVPDHLEAQRVYVRSPLLGMGSSLKTFHRRVQLSEDPVPRATFDLTPEEIGEHLTEVDTVECVIIGYAFRLYHDIYMTQNGRWFNNEPVGIIAPQNLIKKDDITDLLLVVSPKAQMNPHSSLLYVLINPADGLCEAFPVHSDRVFFRHEFRGEESPQHARRTAWLENVRSFCTTEIQSHSIIPANPTNSPSPKVENPRLTVDHVLSTATALQAFFGEKPKLTDVETAGVIQELAASKFWSSKDNINSKEVSLLHQSFVASKTVVPNNPEAQVDFFSRAAKRMKTMRTEQEQTNEIFAETMGEVKRSAMTKAESSVLDTTAEIKRLLEVIRTQGDKGAVATSEDNWLEVIQDFEEKSKACLERLRQIQKRAGE